MSRSWSYVVVIVGGALIYAALHLVFSPQKTSDVPWWLIWGAVLGFSLARHRLGDHDEE